MNFVKEKKYKMHIHFLESTSPKANYNLLMDEFANARLKIGAKSMFSQLTVLSSSEMEPIEIPH
jgi:hypothetical protein